jgi:hypothetical protein
MYTASVLEGLEARCREPLGHRFDLIAGTSIGAVLALALAFEIPMRRILQVFVDKGPEVFSEHAAPTGPVSRLIDLSRSVLGPKYDGAALREILEAELGDATLAQARHPVAIPVVDVEASRTKIFKSPRAGRDEPDGDRRAVDVAMAACAAPAFFPSVAIGGRLYADGGLFAVAPDQIALHEAEHFDRVEPARVRMLSIGTAASGYRPARGVRANAGAVGWLSDGRLILTLISAQQQHVCAMMEDRLGDRYLRLDALWPEEGGLGIDVATPAATRRLLSLARTTLREATRLDIDHHLERG